VSFSWPEADVTCGPGPDSLASLTLALSQVNRRRIIASLSAPQVHPRYSLFDLQASAPSTNPLLISLYSTDPSTYRPVSPPLLQFAWAPPVGSTPAYTTINLPVNWNVDTVVTNRSAIVLSSTQPMAWVIPSDLDNNVPATGFGQAQGSFASSNAGAEWSLDSAPYGAILLLVRKARQTYRRLRVCPFPSAFCNRRARRFVPRQIRRRPPRRRRNHELRRRARLESSTRTQSATRSSSGSLSQSQTKSQSVSQTQSQSATPIGDDFAELDAQPIRERSTPSDSQTRSQSSSMSASQSETPSQSSTPTQSSSASVSQSASQTQSASQSSTPSLNRQAGPAHRRRPKAALPSSDPNSNEDADTESLTEPYSDAITDTNADCLANRRP